MKTLSAVIFIMSASITQANQEIATNVKIECGWGKLTMEMSKRDNSSFLAMLPEPTDDERRLSTLEKPRVTLANAVMQGKLQETCMMLEDLLYEQV